jgi:hypothetical protein
MAVSLYIITTLKVVLKFLRALLLFRAVVADPKQAGPDPHGGNCISSIASTSSPR